MTDTAPPLTLTMPHDGPPPDAVALATAGELLRGIQGVAARREVRWTAPQIASDECGAVDLYWHVEPQWLILTAEPGETAQILMCAQRGGEEPRLWRGSLAEAAEEVAALLPPLYEAPVR